MRMKLGIRDGVLAYWHSEKPAGFGKYRFQTSLVSVKNSLVSCVCSDEGSGKSLENEGDSGLSGWMDIITFLPLL